MATKQKIHAPHVDRPGRVVTETGSWPEATEHRDRLLRLKDFYTDEELAGMLGCEVEKVERWPGDSRGRSVHDNLNFLNHLDAAAAVTRAFEGLLDSECTRELVLRPLERLNGRSLADMVGARDCFKAGAEAQRIAESLKRKRS
ncbi:MAG TPA: hypothetical protein VIF43_01530 [Patescibacteria group bacterium]|jgi:hypothetical protein